ncbi:pyruvate kinase [Desmospora activa]|uniref:Pyruvate kinase n=1 Tax=Desmospora activa DSM 45169 TaxID=1121389 RepID=A0A2T4Z892_9BACL|nr:pyruvate kinase [Desmospora activa]PTM58085.1 pyruvate kinase [Desmospora activa DSM 45169]
MRKTKIVCTIGPASEDLDTLKSLIQVGMNVARLNFSHGDHNEHLQRINRIRQVEKELGTRVALLLDTRGPEIRTGELSVDQLELETGADFTLTTEIIQGDSTRVSVSYSGLVHDVAPGSIILIDDGLISLKVKEVAGTEIHCHIMNGGPLKSRKGVNVPGVSVNLPGITEKDAADIRFGIEQGVDFIAASFVRKPEDVLEIRQILEEYGADIAIISKIENREGVENLESILSVSDGLMVARGDLGVEIPAEEVPIVQKEMIRLCNRLGKPVITATQMLDSMQRNPRPTRAEASDVANAIIDGTDAIMLSGETASGRYPLEAVQTMDRIASRTESSLKYRDLFRERIEETDVSIPDSISQAVVHTAWTLKSSAIITSTESGRTARMVSKYRPQAPIVAVTVHESVLRKLCLIWGVYPLLGNLVTSTDEMLKSAITASLESGYVRHGDSVVITGGVPVAQSGTTNLMKVHVIGDVLAKGQGVGKKVLTGKVVVGTSPQELRDKMTDGAILVTRSTDKDMMDSFERAAAVIVEEGGLTSHAAVVGLSLGIPVVVGVQDAVRLFQDGIEVTVDAERGHIYSGRANVL